MARALFPGGVDASPPDSYSYAKSVVLTQDLIRQGKEIIYEAAFQHAGVLCALDILVKVAGQWHAFEVKSTTGVKDQHVEDAALQYYVITQAGLALVDISIVYLNTDYTRLGALDVKSLFANTSILEQVLPRQQYVQHKIEELKRLLATRAEPSMDIGPHCITPYPCDFTNHCWSHMPKEDSIFDLARGPGWKLYEEGIIHLD